MLADAGAAVRDALFSDVFSHMLTYADVYCCWQMRARLCAMHSSITWPRTRSEYLEWIKVYEKEVMARMLKAKDKADREFSEFQAAALSTGDAVHGSDILTYADVC
jgi:hypothetical protein